MTAPNPGVDSEVARALQCVGFSRSEALIMEYLDGAGRASFGEIEEATCLQVSSLRTALKKLKSGGLIDDLLVQREGSGRTVRLYSLRLPLHRIAVNLEEVEQKQIEELGRSIHRLGELSFAGRA